MSSVTSFVVFAVLQPNSSPVNGVNFGSISTSLQTSGNICRSPRLLCLTDTKPPFLQLMQCCALNLLPQGHVCKFAIPHPYRKRIATEKCCFDSSKPKSLIGSAVSQFDTPFSSLTSNNLLDFSGRLFFNWSTVEWHRSCFSFFYDLFSYFDLRFVDCILLILNFNQRC